MGACSRRWWPGDDQIIAVLSAERAPLIRAVKVPIVEVKILFETAIVSGDPRNSTWKRYGMQHIGQPKASAEREGAKLRVLIVQKANAGHAGQKCRD